MVHPPEIERLRTIIFTMPGVVEVEAEHAFLEDFNVEDLSLASFGDLPHATIRRTSGGLQGEALGQVFIALSPTVQSWRTLEFISWQVRDWSRAGQNIQIRTRGLPPIVGDRIQLGSSLRVIIDLFVSGLDVDPGKLLRNLDEFAKAIELSLRLYRLEWCGETVRARGR